MSPNQNPNPSMSSEEPDMSPRRHGVYSQLAHQTGPTANRAQTCVICLEGMETSAECLIHADGRCLNTWHTECLELELQASTLRTGRARCPNCRAELTDPPPTPAEAQTGRRHATPFRPRTQPNVGAWQTPRRWATHLHEYERPGYYNLQHDRHHRRTTLRHLPETYQRYFNVTAAELAVVARQRRTEQMSDEEYDRLLLERNAARRVTFELHPHALRRPHAPLSVRGVCGGLTPPE